MKIRVSSLLHAAAEISNARYNYVDVSILDGYEDEGEQVPAILHFDVYDKYGDVEAWDDLDIEEIQD